MKTIAEWLDAGITGLGWMDDWDELLYGFSPAEAWKTIDDINLCVSFIKEHTSTHARYISDNEAERVIGSPRP